MAAITILDTIAANIATPSIGKTSIFVDNDALKMKTATGNVYVVGGGITAVESFNTRTGNVTLTSSDVTSALGYTPYDSTNPTGYITSSGTAANISGTYGGTLTSGQVTAALGYTPPSTAFVPLTLIGDITGSGNTSGNITTTLSNTAVSAGVYGDGLNVPQITVDSAGRITSASNVAITGGGGTSFDGNLAGNVLYATVTDSNRSGTANVRIQSPSLTLNTANTGINAQWYNKTGLSTSIKSNALIFSSNVTSGAGIAGLKMFNSTVSQATISQNQNARDGVFNSQERFDYINAGYTIANANGPGNALGKLIVANYNGYGTIPKVIGEQIEASQTPNAGTSNVNLMVGSLSSIENYTADGSSGGTIANGVSYMATVYEGSFNDDGPCDITNWIAFKVDPAYGGTRGSSHTMYSLYSDNSAVTMYHTGAINSQSNITTTGNVNAVNSVMSGNVSAINATMSGDVTAVNFYGKLIRPTTTKTANYSVALTDDVILANGAITVTLPSAVTAGNGRWFHIKRISSAGPVTVNSTSGTIDGNSAVTIDAQWASISVASNGSAWFII